MTDCPRSEIRDLLPDWVNGSLDRDAAADVSEHLTTCAVCRDEADLLGRLRVVLSPEPAIDIRRVAERVVERTSTRGGGAARGKSWRAMVGGLAIAASVVFGALLIQSGDDPDAVSDFRAANAELPVAGGLSGLEEEQLEALLARLDAMEALPQTSTAPAIFTNVALQ
jgi:predicted anti-sigma-YlaC factor YlaD